MRLSFKRTKRSGSVTNTHTPLPVGSFQSNASQGKDKAFYLVPTRALDDQRKLTNRGSFTASDSGMVSYYQEAQHNKNYGPIGRIINRVSRVYQRAFGKVPASQTTEQGAASAASPATFALSLYNLRYERRAIISDVRQMIADCPRAKRSTSMFAREAIRGGCSIIIDKGASRGPVAGRLKIAQECADRVQAIINENVFSWAWMLHVEGDLFLQAILSTTGDIELVDVKRMPADSMERNTDDTDEFIDPDFAFSQVDVNTNEEVATFPLALMYHARWDHIDGERYGTSELLAGRRLRRLLELEEDALAAHRMTRSAMKLHHKIGLKEPYASEKEVSDYMEVNGYRRGARQVFDPNNLVTDIFTNGNVEVKAIDGDANIGEIEDLNHLQEVYFASLPTPASLMNVNSKAINRDVLNEQYSQWLKETFTLTKAMIDCATWIYNQALLFKGILPETINFSIHFDESTTETATEKLERVIKARQNVLAPGRNAVPDPLVDKLHALQLLQGPLGIDDPEAMLRRIEAENSEIMNLQMNRMLLEKTAGQQNKPTRQQPKSPPSKGPNPNTKPKTDGFDMPLNSSEIILEKILNSAGNFTGVGYNNHSKNGHSKTKTGV